MTTHGDTLVGQGRYYHDKKAFINAQVRLLETPMQPPSDWRHHRARLNARGEAHTSIPEGVVSAVLSKLHTISTKSSRMTFNSQSIRQMLEQLEANQYELRKKARQGGVIIRTKSAQEILESDWIDMFPETWQQHQDEAGLSATSNDPSLYSSSIAPLAPTPSLSRLQKYADLRSRIVAMQTRYQELKDKHEYYRTLRTEIRRLDAGEIQKNILSPDSHVIQELERMKVILPRLVSILSSRHDVLSAKRKHQMLSATPGTVHLNALT
ncbi:kinetochore Sim4 complex subunit Fta4 [Gamsiella multidivaricata]|uniref:kinetochore Sim4 complex subunit Fta4 n=1 Tax=Gamsiella multidivaricata TaxID=101098 RepID=UPI00221FDB1C|nr:kinetochore Sim4 complex subunit Fta4 [Gamsiella multidivaricata]KAI7817143.1 kinetochore Sim4 complex subunit Fta4 [Gamsiella multidivaricata]